MCLCDESRDYLAHDPFLHVHMCTVKGMWERTMTIWSISDLFGLPGWNVACLYGPDYFIKRAQLVHQDLVYTLPTQPQVLPPTSNNLRNYFEVFRKPWLRDWKGRSIISVQIAHFLQVWYVDWNLDVKCSMMRWRSLDFVQYYLKLDAG